MFLNSVLPERLLRKKGCSKQIPKEKRMKNPWEKSMLSRWWFLIVTRPAYGPYIQVIFHGEKYIG
jgi:hypothetical protein